MSTQMQLADSHGPIEYAREIPTPLSILADAVKQGLDPDQLGKLMDLQERYVKNDAAQKFAAALTRFQAECPPITKDRTAEIRSDKGSYKYQFASYDDVMRQIKPVLERCGIGVSFSTTKSETGILVTCRIRHGIHSEDHTLDVPVPAMKVNDTQRFGAALSYAKRYALCAALNIVVTDEDDDAQSAYETVSEEQIAQLREWFESSKEGEGPTLKFCKVKSVKEIPVQMFPVIMERFSRKYANS